MNSKKYVLPRISSTSHLGRREGLLLGVGLCNAVGIELRNVDGEVEGSEVG